MLLFFYAAKFHHNKKTEVTESIFVVAENEDSIGQL
jgi:hypothetical protein